jgi:hypothetical protein
MNDECCLQTMVLSIDIRSLPPVSLNTEHGIFKSPIGIGVLRLDFRLGL